ncbi:hypothetical protein SCB49_10742 [unidentified eubacterium SCB49]|nr:hypothetical protein SCB49_10742 [unidentified eubacterium SCB49]
MDQPKSNFLNNPRFYKISVIVLLIIRGIFNAVMPLMDKTEARYAEIARLMAETGNWITPQIDYGVPFWAKPPLSTWLSAASMSIFGVNEFAVRFPYLLMVAGMVLLIGKYAKRAHLPFYLPGFILLLIPELFLHAGVVSTDTALTLAVTLTFLSFWEATHNGKKIWGYLFFVGVGLGLLAKGPIVIILCGPPIFLWMVFQKKYKTVFTKLPWILGLLVTAIVAVPWYYFAEQTTPGFIDYFLVGEHWLRFTDSSWKGDKYGFPKTQPLGIVWVFLLLFALPWIQVIMYRLFKTRTTIFKNEWVLFLLLWLLWTPLFFTVSSSLIHTYIMPVMVPVALLIVHWWPSIKFKKQLALTNLTLIGVCVIALIGITATSTLQTYANTDKYLIEAHPEQIKIDEFYYFGKKSYSSQFYSKGTVQSISIDELKNKEDAFWPFCFIVKKKDLPKLEAIDLSKFMLLGENEKKLFYGVKK